MKSRIVSLLCVSAVYDQMELESPGGGKLSLSARLGVGNRPPSEKKMANPRGYARGGMVTGGIAPYINSSPTLLQLLFILQSAYYMRTLLLFHF